MTFRNKLGLLINHMIPQKKICFCVKHRMIMWINQSDFDLKKHCSIMQTNWKYILISFQESLHNKFSFCLQFLSFCLQFLSIYSWHFLSTIFRWFFLKKHPKIIPEFSQVQVAETIFLLCQCWFKLKTWIKKLQEN